MFITLLVITLLSVSATADSNIRYQPLLVQVDPAKELGNNSMSHVLYVSALVVKDDQSSVDNLSKEIIQQYFSVLEDENKENSEEIKDISCKGWGVLFYNVISSESSLNSISNKYWARILCLYDDWIEYSLRRLKQIGRPSINRYTPAEYQIYQYIKAHYCPNTATLSVVLNL